MRRTGGRSFNASRARSRRNCVLVKSSLPVFNKAGVIASNTPRARRKYSAWTIYHRRTSLLQSRRNFSRFSERIRTKRVKFSRECRANLSSKKSVFRPIRAVKGKEREKLAKERANRQRPENFHQPDTEKTHRLCEKKAANIEAFD